MTPSQIARLGAKIRSWYGPEDSFDQSDVALIWTAAQEPGCALAVEAKRYVEARDEDHYADFVVTTHNHIKETLYRAPPSVLKRRKGRSADFMESTEGPQCVPYASFPYRSIMEFHGISKSSEHPCRHFAKRLVEELRSFYARLPGLESASQRIRSKHAELRNDQPLARDYIDAIGRKRIHCETRSWAFVSDFARNYPKAQHREPAAAFLLSLEAAAQTNGIRTRPQALAKRRPTGSGGKRESIVPSFSAELADLDAAVKEAQRQRIYVTIVKTATSEMLRVAGNRRPAHHGPFNPPLGSLQQVFGDRVGVVVSELWPAMHAYQFPRLLALADLPSAWVDDISDLVWQDCLDESQALDFRDPDNLVQALPRKCFTDERELASVVWREQRRFDRSRLPNLSLSEHRNYAKVAASRLRCDEHRKTKAREPLGDHHEDGNDKPDKTIEKNIPRSTYAKHAAALKAAGKPAERNDVARSVSEALRRKQQRSPSRDALTAGEWAQELGISVTQIRRAIKGMADDGHPLPDKTAAGSYKLSARERALITKYLPVSAHIKVDAADDAEWRLQRFALSVVRKAHDDVPRLGRPTAELLARLDAVQALACSVLESHPDRATLVEALNGRGSVAPLLAAVLRLYKSKPNGQATNSSQPGPEAKTARRR